MVLGYHLGCGKVCLQVENTEATAAQPKTETIQQARALLGLAGYYMRFITAFSELPSPMTDLTCSWDSVQWTKSLLHTPYFKHPIALKTDP